MATNTLGGAMIVKELLKKENYKEWSVCIQKYLFAHDLWDVVEEDCTNPTIDWERKDAAAFHTILISCGKEVVDLILDCSSAGDAWYTLAVAFNSGVFFQVACVYVWGSTIRLLSSISLSILHCKIDF